MAAINPGVGLKNQQGYLLPEHFPGLPEGWASSPQIVPSRVDQLKLYNVLHYSKLPRVSLPGAPPVVLVILHGMGEHGGRYLHFPHYLQHAVAGVFHYDHRGHGHSEGIRGHAESLDELVRDAVDRVHEARAQWVAARKRHQLPAPEPLIHLFGHSLGGLIALRTLQLYPDLPLSAATLSAPLLRVRVPLPWVKKRLAYALSSLWGSLHLTTEVDALELSHDLAVVRAYCEDRLVHGKGTPRFYTSLMAMIEEVLGHQGRLAYPLQMIVPLQDKVVDAEAALSYYRKLQTLGDEKQLVTYPDFFHESFNEVGKEKAFQDLAAWITQSAGRFEK